MASADKGAAGHWGACASGQHSSWEIKLRLRFGEEKPMSSVFWAILMTWPPFLTMPEKSQGGLWVQQL